MVDQNSSSISPFSSLEDRIKGFCLTVISLKIHGAHRDYKGGLFQSPINAIGAYLTAINVKTNISGSNVKWTKLRELVLWHTNSEMLEGFIATTRNIQKALLRVRTVLRQWDSRKFVIWINNMIEKQLSLQSMFIYCNLIWLKNIYYVK